MPVNGKIFLVDMSSPFFFTDVGHFTCRRCAVSFKNNRGHWLKHMYSFHKEEFDEMANEQREKKESSMKKLLESVMTYVE